MRRTALPSLLMLGACVATPPSSSREVQRPATGPAIEVRNGRWYTDTGFRARTFYVVEGVLRSDRPARVDSVINLSGGYVIPPFGDAHTHNLDGTFQLERVRDAYVREGTFYVQVLTNTRTGAEQLRARFNKPCDLDVVYANGGLTSTLSHPFLAYEPRAMGLYGDWAQHAERIRASRLREGNAYWFIDSIADLNAKWPAILAGSPGVIKIFLLDAREEPPPVSTVGLPRGTGLADRVPDQRCRSP